MKIRDAHATINGDKTEHEMPSGALDIIAEDGKSLFSISVHVDGTMEVSACGWCKQQEMTLGEKLMVIPSYSNRILVKRAVEE